MSDEAASQEACRCGAPMMPSMPARPDLARMRPTLDDMRAAQPDDPILRDFDAALAHLERLYDAMRRCSCPPCAFREGTGTWCAHEPETDGVCPAWWRGHDAGVEAAAARLEEVVASTVYVGHHFGSPRLTRLAATLQALKRRLGGPEGTTPP